MRIEGGDGEAIRLVASGHDLQLLDKAFPELLEHAVLDDWLLRTGAARDELVAVWTGIAGARPEPLAGGLAALPISERGIEVLEAVLFELARARTIPVGDLESRTGARQAEWLRLWRLTHGIARKLQLRPQPGERAAAPVSAPDLGLDAPIDVARFRQIGGRLRDTVVSSVSAQMGDAYDVSVERATLRGVVARGIRLVAARLADTDIDGAIEGGAFIDCEFDGVAIAGKVSDARFIGSVCSLLDLRRSTLDSCRFYETVAGDDILLPSGRDCFVVPVAKVPGALEPFRARIGEATFAALSAWVAVEEADHVSIGPSFWRREVVGRGGDADPELEYDTLDRLHRIRSASIGGRSMLASDEPEAWPERTT